MFEILLIIIGIYLIFLFLFFLSFNVIEKRIPETHPFKKWWRKHIVDFEVED